MTKEKLNLIENDYWEEKADPIDMTEVFDLASKAIEQEPTVAKNTTTKKNLAVEKPKIDKYEYHTDHTDCIWHGSGSCPVTCSQYRDGWNDAMGYIFKGGKGYQPYKRNE